MGHRCISGYQKRKLLFGFKTEAGIWMPLTFKKREIRKSKTFSFSNFITFDGYTMVGNVRLNFRLITD